MLMLRLVIAGVRSVGDSCYRDSYCNNSNADRGDNVRCSVVKCKLKSSNKNAMVSFTPINHPGLPAVLDPACLICNLQPSSSCMMYQPTRRRLLFCHCIYMKA